MQPGLRINRSKRRTWERDLPYMLPRVQWQCRSHCHSPTVESLSVAPSPWTSLNGCQPLPAAVADTATKGPVIASSGNTFKGLSSWERYVYFITVQTWRSGHKHSYPSSTFCLLSGGDGKILRHVGSRSVSVCSDGRWQNIFMCQVGFPLPECSMAVITASFKHSSSPCALQLRGKGFSLSAPHAGDLLGIPGIYTCEIHMSNALKRKICEVSWLKVIN